MFYDIFSGMRERKPGRVLNILLRACRCARLDRAKKIRKGENSCRMGRKIPLEGWDSLSDDTKKIRKYSPRNGKNVRSGGKFIPKNEDFSFEKIQEKRKKYRNGQKNFSVPLGKRQEKLFRRSEKISENG